MSAYYAIKLVSGSALGKTTMEAGVILNHFLPSLDTAAVRVYPLECVGFCSMRLGVLDAGGDVIDTDDYSATSVYGQGVFGSENFRPKLDSASAWVGFATNGVSSTKFLEVRVQSSDITSIVTQGRKDYDQRVTRYALHYRARGSTVWRDLGLDFQGNYDQNTKVTHRIEGLSGPMAQGSSGWVEEGLAFDGVDDSVQLPSWEMGGATSVEAYVRYASFKNWSRIIDFGNGADDENLVLYNVGETGTCRWFYSDNKVDAEDCFVINEWVHIVATVSDAGVMKLYKNGELVGTEANGLVPNTLTRLQHYVGKSNLADDALFDGVIRYVGVYDREVVYREDGATTLNIGLAGAFSLDICEMVPPGYSLCSNGVWDATACSRVAPGYYNDGSGTQPCPSGRWSSLDGLSASDDCGDCSAGKWSSATGLSSDCEDCSAGKWSSATGLSSDCEDSCPAGKWSSLVGLTSEDTCEGQNCPAGRYSTFVGVSKEAGCENRDCIGVAYYCPAGSTEPIAVSPNHYTIPEGAEFLKSRTGQLPCSGAEVCGGGIRSRIPGSFVFTNVAAGSGVDDAQNARGVTVGDLDGDNDLDILVANFAIAGLVSGGSKNLLYRNDGNLIFSDISSSLSNGADQTNNVVMGDLDQDGDLDIFVVNSDYLGATATHRLYRNDGNMEFSDVTSGSNLNLYKNGFGAAMGDLDGDGDLDIILACDDKQNRLFRNDGGLVFTDVGSDIQSSEQELGVTLGDVDGDGDLDAYFTARNSNQMDSFYRNDGNLAFTMVDLGLGSNSQGAGRGVAFADLDSDGDLDIFVTKYDRLYRNDGNLNFVDVTSSTNVDDAGVSSGVALADFNGDGFLDIYLGRSQGTANKLYANDGAMGFTDVSSGSNVDDLESPQGFAVGDMDNDGDLDIFVSIQSSSGVPNQGGPNRLYRNDDSNSLDWLFVRPLDFAGHQTLHGATVRLLDASGALVGLRTIDGGGGYLSQSAYDAHFGLGTAGASSTYDIEVRLAGAAAWITKNDLPALGGVTPRQTHVVELRYPPGRRCDDKCVSSLNAYEATLTEIGGTAYLGSFYVWATGDDTYTSVTYAGSFNGIPDTGDCSAPNACGIHIHSGNSCTDASAQGGHFFTGSVTSDPWGPVKYSDDNGVEGINTPENTASIAAQTLDIGTGAIEGLVAVLHDEAGARIACGVLTKKSSYIANVAASNGNAGAATSATVAAMTTSNGEVFMVGSGTGFEADLDDAVCDADNECGYHVHTGTLCADAAAQGGHYYLPTTGPDPWLGVRYEPTDGSGSASFESWTAAGTPDIEGRAVVFHNAAADRVACGTLAPKNIMQMPVERLNAYEATLTEIGGTANKGAFYVWATGDDTYTSVTYAGSFNGIPDTGDCSAPNACGIHIHSGYSCTDAGAQGGHFFTGSVTSDPWRPVKYSDDNGVEGTNTPENTASIAAQTLDIGTGAIEGLVAVLHNKQGGRIACGVLTKKSSYIANVAASNGNDGAATSATVAATTTRNGEVFIVGSGTGFEANLGDAVCDADNECGYHVHTGTSCADTAAQGGHFFTTATDPWLGVRYEPTDGSGSASFESWTAAGTPNIEGRAVVFHTAAAGRVACGILYDKRVSSLNAYEATLTEIGGTANKGAFYVWATGDDTYTSVTYAGSFNGIPATGDCSAPNACGIHIHSGYSCTDAGAQGGHFFTGSVTSDPWGPVKYSDDNGVEGTNTPENTASIAAQTLDIGTGAIEGLVAVLHNKQGGRIACGVLTKKSSYIANVAASNGNAGAATSATVAATTTRNGEVFIVGSGTGFEANLGDAVCDADNECGYHVHTGTSCADDAAQGGHYYLPTTATDPWLGVRYEPTDGSGSASFESWTAAGTPNIEGRAVVFHNAAAGRVACGTLIVLKPPCPAGTFNANEGATSVADCIACSAGNYCPAGSVSDDQPCPAGFFCETPDSIAPCSAGRYCPPLTNRETPCPTGSYCPTGSVEAIPCPEGSFNGAENSTSVAACQLCSAGTYCPAGSAAEIPCPPGTYSEAGQEKCEACGVGYYCTPSEQRQQLQDGICGKRSDLEASCTSEDSICLSNEYSRIKREYEVNSVYAEKADAADTCGQLSFEPTSVSASASKPLPTDTQFAMRNEGGLPVSFTLDNTLPPWISVTSSNLNKGTEYYLGPNGAIEYEFELRSGSLDPGEYSYTLQIAQEQIYLQNTTTESAIVELNISLTVFDGKVLLLPTSNKYALEINKTREETLTLYNLQATSIDYNVSVEYAEDAASGWLVAFTEDRESSGKLNGYSVGEDISSSIVLELNTLVTQDDTSMRPKIHEAKVVITETNDTSRRYEATVEIDVEPGPVNVSKSTISWSQDCNSISDQSSGNISLPCSRITVATFDDFGFETTNGLAELGNFGLSWTLVSGECVANGPCSGDISIGRLYFGRELAFTSEVELNANGTYRFNLTLQDDQDEVIIAFEQEFLPEVCGNDNERSTPGTGLGCVCVRNYGRENEESRCIECQPGEFWAGYETGCEECAAGKQKLNPGEGDCTDCGAGSISFQGQSCTKCEDGSEPSDDSTECQECPVGYYKSSSVNVCTQCDAGLVANAEGSTNCTQCEAGKAANDDRSDCALCEPGEISAGDGGGCSLCPAGTYEEDRQTCRDCDEGKFQPSDGETDCDECEVGKYQNDARQTGCKACAAGEYADDQGLEKCKTCPPGRSQPAEEQDDCIDCAAGKYQNVPGQTDCGQCASLLRTPTEDRTDCEDCVAGEIVSKEDALWRCVPCQPGKYLSQNGDEPECTTCRPGSYAPEPSATECIQCNDPQSEVTDESAVTCKPCRDSEMVVENECVCNDRHYKVGEGCEACPEGGDCSNLKASEASDSSTRQSSEVMPLKGYWRPPWNEYLFVECRNEKACTVNGTRGATDEDCGEGHRGPLCEVCAPGYMHTVAGTDCVECYGQSVQGLIFVLCVAFGVILAIVIIRTTINSAGNPSRIEVQILKITASYLQLVAMVRSFPLRWPEVIMSMYDVFDFASSAGESALASIECLNDGVGGGEGDLSPFIVSATVLLMIPFMSALAAATFWFGLKHFRRINKIPQPPPVAGTDASVYPYVNGFVVTMVVLLFLLHPTLTRTGLRFFSCSREDMGGPTFLEADFEMECWESEHLQWSLTVGAALIVLYAVGIPILSLVLLRRARRQGLRSWRPVLGFLFNGFKPEFYYWEVVILSRKVAFALISVLLEPVGIDLQAYAGLGLIAVAMMLQLKFSPYENPQINRMELLGLIVSYTTVFSGLFLFSDSPGNGFKVFISITIVAINAGFLFYVMFSLRSIFMSMRARLQGHLRRTSRRAKRSISRDGGKSEAVTFNTNQSLGSPTNGEEVIEMSSLNPMYNHGLASSIGAKGTKSIATETSDASGDGARPNIRD